MTEFIFETVQNLMQSKKPAQGDGQIWRAGPYLYVEDSKKGDIKTAAHVLLRYIYADQFQLNALGPASGATLFHAIDLTQSNQIPIFHTGAFTESLTYAQSFAFLQNWDRINFMTAGARIVLDHGMYDLADRKINLTNPYHRNLEVSGKQYRKRNILASKVLSQAPFDHHVEFQLEKAPETLKVGDHIAVDAAKGPDGCSIYQGVCEVLSIDGKNPNLVTVRIGYPHANLPTTQSIRGRYRAFTTCLKWQSGRGLAVTTIGGIIRNLIIKGYHNPVIDAPSDGPNDGVLIGEQADNHESNITQGEQVNFGWVQMVSVGVTNWPNNGFQNKGGKMRGVDVTVSLCGHRGFQMGNGGGGVVKGIVSSWNANGLEAESGAVITATEGAFVGNLKQGAYALNAKLNISDSITEYNGTHGMDAGFLGDIQALRVKSQFNARNGILCDDLGRVVCQDGVVMYNNTDKHSKSNQVVARDGGHIVLRGSDCSDDGLEVKSGGCVIGALGHVFRGKQPDNMV